MLISSPSPTLLLNWLLSCKCYELLINRKYSQLWLVVSSTYYHYSMLPAHRSWHRWEREGHTGNTPRPRHRNHLDPGVTLNCFNLIILLGLVFMGFKGFGSSLHTLNHKDINQYEERKHLDLDFIFFSLQCFMFWGLKVSNTWQACPTFGLW